MLLFSLRKEKKGDSLNSQKSSAQAEVNSASAELARLQKLKTFGEQELQRKKTVLATLNTEVNSFKSQISSKQNSLNSLKSQLTSIQTQYNSAVAYQNAVNTKNAQAEILDKRWRGDNISSRVRKFN